MTGTINETSHATAPGSALSELSTEITLVVVLTLIGLLAINELVRAYRGASSRPAGTGLYVAILPLTAAAGFIIIVRLLTIVDRL